MQAIQAISAGVLFKTVVSNERNTAAIHFLQHCHSCEINLQSTPGKSQICEASGTNWVEQKLIHKEKQARRNFCKSPGRAAEHQTAI